MKKFLKIMLCIMGSLLAVIVLFWCCISYAVNYKKTTCDTSVSPNKKYELTLQAVGEPDWPFGSASGRLVLMEGKDPALVPVRTVFTAGFGKFRPAHTGFRMITALFRFLAHGAAQHLAAVL